MKSFKDYLKDLKPVKLPALETVFGKHSQEQESKKLPALKTRFGSHSTPKKLNEIVTQEEQDEIDDHIHNVVVPLNHEHLKPHHAESLTNYTQDSSSLNSALHDHYKGEMGDYQRQINKKDINHITDILNNHKTTEDTHVYTGVHFSPAKHFKYDKQGNPHPHVDMHMPAFTSTSSDPNQAREFSQRTHHEKDDAHGVEHTVNRDKKPFAKHVLKIKMPKGTSAASVRDLSGMDHEQEILLNRGHNIRIHSHPTHADDGTMHWNADIIGHDPKPL